MMVPTGWANLPGLHQPFTRPNRRAAFTLAENSLAYGSLVNFAFGGSLFR
jgi:hypothetical protein